MTYLALDLSKSNTGWCWWDGEAPRPVYGSWCLGSEMTPDGQVFQKLHTNLIDHFSLMPFRVIFVEEPINPGQLQGKTTIHTIRLAVGLATHVQSFAHAYGCRVAELNISEWRADFIGRVENNAAKAEARRLTKLKGRSVSATPSLKALTIARCRQLGFTPRKDDEADAIGQMTHGLLIRQVTPPWLRDEVLRASVLAEVG